MDRRAFVAGSLPLLALGTAAAQPGGKDAADRAPLAKDAAEKKILDVLDDLDRNQRRGNMNVPLEDARLLRLLAAFGGAKHVVELGTSNGYSGIWICLALRQTGGKLSTFDIDEGRIKLAKANFKRAGVDKLITLIEGDAHENVKKLQGPLDLVFIDADKSGYLDYLQKLLPLVRPGGVIAAHNMARPKPDPKFVEAITTNKELDTIFLNMQNQGMALSLKKG